MCEATAYVLRDGEEEVVLEHVDSLENQGDSVRLLSLFGEEKIVKGRVARLTLIEHKIILEPD